MTPITDHLTRFQWIPAATRVFTEIKGRMTKAPVMRLSDFLKLFEVTCDALRLAIGGVLSQESHLVANFSEKLNDVQQRYSTYDKKFYAIIQALATRGITCYRGNLCCIQIMKW